MSQSGVVAWSQTANTNATADSNVNWAEGMAPAAVNDSARSEMASVAKWRDDFGGGLVAGGTSTAYTLTTNQTFSTLGYLNGQKLSFSVNTTNGASATLNVDGLGAKAIQIGAVSALPEQTFRVGTRYDVSYNSSGGFFVFHGYPGAIVPASVSTGAIIGTSISTSGTANFAGTLTGAAIVASSITTSGNAFFAGTLTVTGVTTLSGFMAAQSDQETATSTTLAVSPGRQQFHPSAVKCWIEANADGTIPASYNVTSITDGGPGTVTVTIATDFSSSSYSIVNGTQITVAGTATCITSVGSGSFVLVSFNTANNSATDPDHFHAAAFGDQ